MGDPQRRRNLRRPAVVAGLLLFVLSLLFLNRILAPPPGEAAGGYDTRGLFYPWMEHARNALLQGRLPLWDRLQFAGYPFLSNPQVALFYPPTWLAVLLPVNWGIGWHVAWHVWWAGLGMWLFVRRQGGSWLGAFLAALVFAFSGFAAARIWAGHIGLLATNSWIPWILLGTNWSIKRKSVDAGVVAGLPFGLAILAGHTASLLYITLIWFTYAFYLGLTGRRWWLVGRQVILAMVVGVTISAVQLGPLLQFSLVSTRATEATYEFATAFSFPPAHLITLLVPEFFGEPTRAGYWSVPNFEELTYYVGILPLIGLLLALRRPSRLAWFYVALIILGLLLAFGNYGFLFPLAYRLLPIFKLARAPGRAAVLFTFAASALLGETITTWENKRGEGEREEGRQFLVRLLGVTAVAGLASLAATGAMFAAQHPTETSGRLWHQLGGWAMALLFGIVGIALVRSYFSQTKHTTAIAAALVLLSITDLWSFGYKLVRPEAMAPQPYWVDARAIIGETSERVLPWGISIFDQNGAEQVGLASVFGYNALEVGANTAFAASVPDPRSTAYDILGAGYVISQVPLDRYLDGERPLELVDHTDNVWVYRRGRVLPLARLVANWEVIADRGAATARVHEVSFDPATTVILERRPNCNVAPSTTPPGSVTVDEVRDGYWRLQTDSPSSALLVLSETAYPGWWVTVSGEEAEPLTAYTTIRAVCVPAGQHIVEWQFTPQAYIVGGAISFVGLLAVAYALFALRRERQEPHSA